MSQIQCSGWAGGYGCPNSHTPEIGRASKSIPIQLMVVFDGNEDDIVATVFLKKIFERKKKKG